MARVLFHQKRLSDERKNRNTRPTTVDNRIAYDSHNAVNQFNGNLWFLIHSLICHQILLSVGVFSTCYIDLAEKVWFFILNDIKSEMKRDWKNHSGYLKIG